MSMALSMSRPRPGREWLAAIAVIYGFLLFLLPTALRLTYSSLYSYLQNTPQPVISWGTIWFISFLRSFLFSSVISYLLVSLMGLLLIGAALLWSRHSWIALVLLLVTLLSIVIYPLLNQYHPSLTPAPGYEMQVPTQPGPLEGIIKSTQITVELETCHYTLLGWDITQKLFYKEQCYSGPEQVWSYDPAQQRAQSVLSEPSDLVMNTCPGIVVSDWVRVPLVYPPEAEPDVRRAHLEGNSRPSPDCRWIAAITRYIYGPEDVVLLRKVD